jgi:hypothetical protein
MKSLEYDSAEVVGQIQGPRERIRAPDVASLATLAKDCYAQKLMALSYS